MFFLGEDIGEGVEGVVAGRVQPLALHTGQLHKHKNTHKQINTNTKRSRCGCTWISDTWIGHRTTSWINTKTHTNVVACCVQPLALEKGQLHKLTHTQICVHHDKNKQNTHRENGCMLCTATHSGHRTNFIKTQIFTQTNNHKYNHICMKTNRSQCCLRSCSAHRTNFLKHKYKHICTRTNTSVPPLALNTNTQLYTEKGL